MHHNACRRILSALVLFTAAVQLAAAPVVRVRVPADGSVVKTGVVVQRGGWMQLTPTGTWRVFPDVGYADYRGHLDVVMEGAKFPLGALMVQVGDGDAAPLADALPFTAAAAGEVRLFCNYEQVPKGSGEGALNVVIVTGPQLAAVRAKADEERREKEVALAADAEVQGCLQAVNAVRKAAGLAPVALSVDLSEGCTLHARYLAVNWGRPEVEGLKAHQEQETLTGYTASGKRPGASSVINYVSPTASVASWVGTFYHRIPLLQPDLVSIGIGYTQGGPGWISVLDCVSDLAHSTQVDYVRYPTEGQTGVPRFFQDEIPSPVPAGRAGLAGFPLTVYFAHFQKVSGASLTLVDSRKQAVTGYYSDPEHPATFFDQWRAVCFIPAQALKPGERYTAHLVATMDGRPVDDTWSFTTAQGAFSTLGGTGAEGGTSFDLTTNILGGLLVGSLIGIAVYFLLTLFIH